MEFKEFSNYVCEKVGKRLGDGYKLNTAPVLKNNGIILHGVSFCRDKSLVSPTVYLESFYDAYESGVPLEYVIESMSDVFINNDYDFDLDFSQIMDFDKMENRICCKVINYEKNKTLADDCPFVRLMDLCVMFYISVGSTNGEEGSVKITNSLLKSWDISLSELYRSAVKNTKNKLGIDVTNIKDVLIDILKDNSKINDNEDYLDELIQADPSPMYVLSNSRRFYGATCMLFTEELGKFSDALGADLFILPSSVHELILIPDYEDADPKFLYDMVREVNENEVSEHDFLSTNVYKYERETKRVFDIFGAQRVSD